MIDEDIEKYLREIVEDAYPNVTRDQILVLFPSAELSFAIDDLKRCADGIPIAFERINCRLVISHEIKLEREAIIQRIPRGLVRLNGSDIEQEIRRVTHTDNVEVINFKGILFEIIFGHKIFKL